MRLLLADLPKIGKRADTGIALDRFPPPGTATPSMGSVPPRTVDSGRKPDSLTGPSKARRGA